MKNTEGLAFHKHHDNFFKQIISNKKKAEALLQGSLPDEIIKNLELSSLKPDPTAYVDNQLQNSFSDYVYNCRYKDGNRVKIAFLFEHKSTIPKNIHLQLLKYRLRIWDSCENNKEPLKLVLPIVVYHGQKKWKIKDFEQHFAGDQIPPELAHFVPKSPFWLINLQEAEPEEIESRYKHQLLTIELLTLKFIKSPNILRHLPLIFKEIDAFLKDESGKENFDAILLYLFSATRKQPEQILNVMEKYVIPELIEGTAAWYLVERGKKEGKAEGKIEGKIEGKVEGKIEGEAEKLKEVSKKMLEEGCSFEFVMKITGLSETEIREIQAGII